MNSKRVYSDERVLHTALAATDERLRQEIRDNGSLDAGNVQRACIRAHGRWAKAKRGPAPITARHPAILQQIAEVIAATA